MTNPGSAGRVPRRRPPTRGEAGPFLAVKLDAPSTSSVALGMISLAALAVALFVPPVAQPTGYHAFADSRPWLGVPNFLDVVSNAGFAVAGVAGLVVTFTAHAAFKTPMERLPYAAFFAALVLTALGSAWYHLAPDNERLFWDRLPMTLAFMSLLCAQLADRVNARAGALALLPLMLAGAATVVYWRATERAGAGNLVPYAALQLLAVASLALMVVVRSRYSHGGAIAAVIAAYLAAKLGEHYDRAILDATHVVSGHTLKHAIAALGGFIVAWMVACRQPRPGA